MFQEKRPTCVTVIGWAWIIIGGLMCFSSAMGLLSFSMIGQMSQQHPESQQNMPAIFNFFPLLAVIQILLGGFGLFSAMNFLKLKESSRKYLEILTWLLLIFIVGFSIFWVFNWITMTSGHGPGGFSVMGAIMGVVVTGIYGVPLGVMLKFLRGDKVKTAMTTIA